MFFFLFRAAFNDFLMSPIDNENPKLKLAIRRGVPLTLRNDAIEKPPLVYVWIRKIWWLFVFVIFLHVFTVCWCISMYCMTHSSSNSLFLPLITYQYRLIILILLRSFLMLLAMLNRVEKIMSRVKPIYFESFQTDCK